MKMLSHPSLSFAVQTFPFDMLPFTDRIYQWYFCHALFEAYMTTHCIFRDFSGDKRGFFLEKWGGIAITPKAYGKITENPSLYKLFSLTLIHTVLNCDDVCKVWKYLSITTVTMTFFTAISNALMRKNSHKSYILKGLKKTYLSF